MKKEQEIRFHEIRETSKVFTFGERVLIDISDEEIDEMFTRRDTMTEDELDYLDQCLAGQKIETREFKQLPEDIIKLYLLLNKLTTETPVTDKHICISYNRILDTCLFENVNSADEMCEFIFNNSEAIVGIATTLRENGRKTIGSIYTFLFNPSDNENFEVAVEDWFTDFIFDFASKYTIEEIPALVQYIKHH